MAKPGKCPHNCHKPGRDGAALCVVPNGCCDRAEERWSHDASIFTVTERFNFRNAIRIVFQH